MKQLLIIVLITISVGACKKSFDDLLVVDEGIERINRVQTVEVTKSKDPIPIYAIGKVASDQETKLSFKIGGVVEDIRFDEGDFIRAGQILATLRTNEIDAQVLKAQRGLEKAKRDLDRISRMFADSAATLENVQDLTTLTEVAQADLDIAAFNQTYSKIISAVNGRVLRRLSEPNELVSPGQPILIIGNNGLGRYILKVSISDRDVTRIRTGDKAVATFDAFPGEMIEGQVSQIAESADPITGTFDIDILLNGGGRRFRNGYVGRVEMFTSQQQPYWKIPINAIVEGHSANLTVYCLSKDSTVESVIVNPFYISTDFVAVYGQHLPEAPLNIITSGGQFLSPGDAVSVH